MGNPTSYLGHTLTWKKCKKIIKSLKKYSKLKKPCNFLLNINFKVLGKKISFIFSIADNVVSIIMDIAKKVTPND